MREKLTTVSRPLCIFLLVLLGVLSSTAASAAEPVSRVPTTSRCQSDLACRSVFTVALRCFEDGDYETALEGFQFGFESTEDPLLLVHIGRTLAKLGRHQAALDHYRQYQRAVSLLEPLPRDEVQRDIAELEAKVRPDTVALCRPPERTTAAPERPQGKLFYRRGWFWAVAGAGTAALVLGLGLGLALPNTPSRHQTVQWNH